MNSTVKLSSYSVFSGNLSQIKVKNKCVINTINQFSYAIAERDEEFKQALIHSDILLPDGVGITAAIKFLNSEKIEKIAGTDLHSHFLKDLNKNGGRCFYLGSSNKTLELIKKRLKMEYPNITAGSYSPPYKENFSTSDSELMIEAVNKFKPDVLFVGMTAPKQEKWVFNNQDKLRVRILCSVGAVFDFYAGTVKRPSKFWQGLGLEWFMRMIKEPLRMYKRYLFYGPYFMGQILAQKIGGLNLKQYNRY